jgi:heme exporter protein C
MKQNWWKILCVLIFIYVFVFGLLLPIKPGIERVSKNTAKAGDTLALTMYGYNTAFKSATDIRVWLKFDSANVVEGHQLLLKSDQELTATFILPKYLPTKSNVQKVALILDSDIDGAFPYPDALELSQDSIKPAAAVFTDKIAELHKTPFITFPFRNILAETIRNTYFHVPLWFAMMYLFGASSWFAYQYLKNPTRQNAIWSVSYVSVGLLFGILGIVTGAIWANYTWGKPWSFDVKQNMAAICVLMYWAYFILRGTFDDEEKAARVASVYNIFAFFAMIPLLFVIPRLTDSLHPGNGGNPAFGGQDLDNTMRLIFYPAIIAFILLGVWLAQLWARASFLQEQVNEAD